MEDVFAAVDARPKRRQGVTGQTIEAQMRGTMCQISEYELDMLRDEITRLRERLEKVERERDNYNAMYESSLVAAVQMRRYGFRADIEAAARLCDAEMDRLYDGRHEGYGAGLYDEAEGLAADIRDLAEQKGDE